MSGITVSKEEKGFTNHSEEVDSPPTPPPYSCASQEEGYNKEEHLEYNLQRAIQFCTYMKNTLDEERAKMKEECERIKAECEREKSKMRKQFEEERIELLAEIEAYKEDAQFTARRQIILSKESTVQAQMLTTYAKIFESIAIQDADERVSTLQELLKDAMDLATKAQKQAVEIATATEERSRKKARKV